jgi:hypothetical protein
VFMNSTRLLCERQKRVASHRTIVAVTAALAALFLSLPLFSQGGNGNIQGGVFDQTGGAIAGATVTVIDVARGLTRPLTTDSAGEYLAANINPGMYTVRGEAKGFQTIEHSNVLVEVGQTIRIDLTLTPGAQTQTVTVTSEAPQINASDATLGGTVSNADINALPLNGRNFIRLLQLRPGVYASPGGGFGGRQSTNGARNGTDLLLLEGLPLVMPSTGAMTLNSTYRSGDSQSLLPIDAIQEFNTEQNPKAEYGWRPGSVIDVGVKSGTNALHGTAYAFGRDAQALDARNAFTAPTQPAGVPTILPAEVEQFGATGGYRILKDKLFFFANYEGLRTYVSSTFDASIPRDLAGGGKAVSMIDACNTVTNNGANPGALNSLSKQLAGITVGASGCTVTAASSTVENLFPTNLNSTADFYPGFATGLTTVGPLNNGLAKIDYALGEHHHISGVYYTSKSYQTANATLGQLTPQWASNVPGDVSLYNASWTWTPNSTWVNEARGGYGYLNAQTLSADRNVFTQGAWPNGYGFNSGITQASPVSYGGMPNITIGGFTGFLGAGRRTGIRGPEGGASFTDNVSYLRGKHAFKFGFQMIEAIYDNNNFNYANGKVAFSNLTNFLSGTVKNGTLLVGNPNEVVRAGWYGTFFQDDWRLTPRLTLNLGLRWEYQGRPVERNNYEATFNPNVAAGMNPVQQVGGSGMPPMYNAYLKAFSPRVGVAWDVQGNGKTVVRAAASLLREPELVGEYVQINPFGANIPSLGINTGLTNPVLNAHSITSLTLAPANINWIAATLEPNATAAVFPVGAASMINGISYSGETCLAPGIDVVAAGNIKPTQCSAWGVNPNFVQPYVVAWNVDVQRAITNNLTVDVAYVGTHGANQTDWIDINAPVIGAGWAGTPASNCIASSGTNYNNCNADPTKEVGQNKVCTACPYGTKFPFLSNIAQLNNADYSNYNALQITANERAFHGLSFLSSYTFSHCLDFKSGENSSTAAFPIDTYNPKLNYGPCDFDVQHRFSFSPTYKIPGIKSPGQMLQGWAIAGIVSLQSGLPWFPNDGTNDLLGTNEYQDSINGSGIQFWNYAGPTSAFRAGPSAFPCYSNQANPNANTSCIPTNGAVPTAVTQAWNSCMTAAAAPYGGPTTNNGMLALASLNNSGCYITPGGGMLTPPAYGTLGNATRNIFRIPPFHNVDFSVSKDWKFKERIGVQFRGELFNIFNFTNYAGPAISDPGKAAFGAITSSPDVANTNPVLGSGGPRHIQFGLKITY